MSKRKRKIDKRQIVRRETNYMSNEEIINIQAEAYYRALKRIEDEQAKADEEKMERKKYKWYENILFVLNVFFFPWKVNKRFSISNRIYDSVLVLFVSGVMQFTGSVIWVISIAVMGYEIYKIVSSGITSDCIYYFSIAGFFLLLASIFILAGDEFSKETDSNNIYAYSASIVALISCVVSIIALVAK